MRGVPKTLVAVIAVLLLAIGLAACGGGGDDSSSTAGQATTQAESGSGEGNSSQGADKSGKETKSGSGSGSQAAGKSDGGDGSSAGGSSSGGGKKASEFVPKPHSDSGGGSSQYKTKGGDNSIQEYGQEAEGSEFEAAATALHNFLDARAEENWAAACEYLSQTTKDGFQKLAAQAKPGIDTSCGGILEALTNPEAKQAIKAEAEQADARSLRTEGERGFLIYTATEGTAFSMPMVNEGGAWKVASLAGSPIR